MYATLLLVALADPVRLGTADLRHGGVVRAVAFSPDGKLLASAGHDRLVSLWHVPSGKEAARCAGHEGDATCVAWSPDGKTLASGSADGTVRLWDAAGKSRCAIELADDVSAVAFSPDGKALAVGADRSLFLVDTATLKVRPTAMPQAVSCVAWSPDGTEIACNGAIVRADGGGSRPFARPAVNAIAWSGKRIATWEPGGAVYLWDAASGDTLRAVPVGAGFPGGARAMLYQIAFDGKRLAAGTVNGRVHVWDADGKPGEGWPGHAGRVTAVALHGTRLASAGDDGVIRLWDAAGGKRLSPASPFEQPVRTLIGHHDGWLTIRLDGGAERLYEPATKTLSEQRIDDGVASSADGRVTAFRADGAFYVRRGGVRRQLDVREPRFAPVLSPNGSFLTGLSGAAAVPLFDARSGHLLRTVVGHRGSVAAAAFSPDERTLVTGGRDNMLCFWDVDTGRPRSTPRGHAAAVTAVAAGGALVASGCADGTVQVRAARGGRLLKEVSAHRGPVAALAFVGSTLASGGADTSVLLWDVSGLSAGKPAALTLGDAEREELWKALLGGDAARASSAQERLALGGEGVLALIRHDVRRVEAGQTARWVRDLDSDEYETREAACAGLRRCGPLAEGVLNRVLEGKPSLDVRRRVERLLRDVMTGPSGDALRHLRSVEVLELLATPRAEYALLELASGAADAELTARARSALERLRRR